MSKSFGPRFIVYSENGHNHKLSNNNTINKLKKREFCFVPYAKYIWNIRQNLIEKITKNVLNFVFLAYFRIVRAEMCPAMFRALLFLFLF